jgi:hypothetical protein
MVEAGGGYLYGYHGNLTVGNVGNHRRKAYEKTGFDELLRLWVLEMRFLHILSYPTEKVI